MSCYSIIEPENYRTQKPTLARVPFDSYDTSVKGGDITTSIGEYLVILRQDYLISVKLKDKNNNKLEPISKINTIQGNASIKSGQKELFSSGNRIALVGYSSILSALEVGIFALDQQGKLKYISTHYVSACQFTSDYFTLIRQSRLVEKQLVMYLAAHSAGYANGGSCGKVQPHASRAPAPFMFNTWGTSGLGKWQTLPSLSHYPSGAKPNTKTNLHAVLYCDFSGSFSCKIKTIQNEGFASSFYVSKRSVYLWSIQNKWNEEHHSYEANVYKMPSQPGKGDVLLLKAFGIVANRQSMYESPNGDLYAAVVANLNDSPKPHESLLYPVGKTTSFLLHASQEDFKKNVASSIQVKKIELPKHTIYRRLQNRFMGNYYIYGMTWHNEESKASSEKLYILDLPSKKAHIVPLKHDVEEIQIIKEKGVIVHGTSPRAYKGIRVDDSPKLYLSSIAIGKTPVLKSTVIYDLLANNPAPDLSGYKPITTRNSLFYDASLNIISLPLQFGHMDYKTYPYGAAQMPIYQIKTDLTLKRLGVVTAPMQKAEIPASELYNDAHTPLQISSEKFYENTRLLFHNNRSFALMGEYILELDPQKASVTSSKNFFRNNP
jgi:hypothetical protein